MALKTVFSSADEIPEGLKDHYVEKDGKFILALDGDMPGHVPEAELNALKAKVAEFRDTNTSVMKTRDELKAQLLTGYNVIDESSDVEDSSPHSHGTAVTGIIAAIGNNGKGVAGVTWNTKILPIKFLHFTCNYLGCYILPGDGGLDSDIAEAVAYAVDSGADIVNMSLNSQSMPLTKSEIEDAQSEDILFVCSAGNALNYSSPGIDTDTATVGKIFPCQWDEPNVICVAAVNEDGDKAGFSNYGVKTVHLGAPGTSIFSTVKNDGYDEPGPAGDGYPDGTGTSYAAPIVSGIAALMKAANPSYTMMQIKEFLLLAAQPTSTGDLEGITHTGAMANANTAVKAFGDSFDDGEAGDDFFSNNEPTGGRWAVAQNGDARCDPSVEVVSGTNDQTVEMKYAKAAGQGGSYWTHAAYEDSYPPEYFAQVMVLRVTTSDGSGFADDKGRVAVSFVEEDTTSTETCSQTSDSYTEMDFGGSSLAGIELDGSGTATAFLFFHYPEGGGYTYDENYYDGNGEPFSVSSYTKLSITILYGSSSMRLRVADSTTGSTLFEKTGISYPTTWWPGRYDFKPVLSYYGVDTGDSSEYTLDARAFLSVR